MTERAQYLVAIAIVTIINLALTLWLMSAVSSATHYGSSTACMKAQRSLDAIIKETK